jgi:hypothetical protein
VEQLNAQEAHHVQVQAALLNAQVVHHAQDQAVLLNAQVLQEDQAEHVQVVHLPVQESDRILTKLLILHKECKHSLAEALLQARVAVLIVHQVLLQEAKEHL